MVSVASLLNPLPPSPIIKPTSILPGSNTLQSLPTPSASPTTVSNGMSKSTKVFVKSKSSGMVNYKPCEARDEKIAAEHLKFQMGPLDRISDNPRHIPYSSDKKSFQQQTGRDAIDAYHYSFLMPGDIQKDEHTIMWDYNIGLVRITALFKSLKHSKTMPAKVMSANKGLREISHSITGGSITAQGYWVPYEAAKAAAATFCWKIRYALTPVFGADFPQLCVEPGSPAFMSLRIDPAIVKRCEEAARMYRVQSPPASLPKTPHSLTRNKGGTHRTPKLFKAKMTDIESGYGTDSERSPLGSPLSKGSDLWVPVNTPRSNNWSHYQMPTPEKSPPTVVLPESKDFVSVANGKKLFKKRGVVDSGSSSDVSPTNTVATKRRKLSIAPEEKILTQEALAAQTLLALHRAD